MSRGHGIGSGAERSRSAESGETSRAFGAAPSTRSTDPLMKPAAGDRRKQIAADTSDSVPSLEAGMPACALARCGCIQSGYVSKPDDAIDPGATALTRTPLGAHSTAAVSVKLTMPARAAPEWPMPT